MQEGKNIRLRRNTDLKKNTLYKHKGKQSQKHNLMKQIKIL
jgi:hypothetical protein